MKKWKGKGGVRLWTSEMYIIYTTIRDEYGEKKKEMQLAYIYLSKEHLLYEHRVFSFFFLFFWQRKSRTSNIRDTITFSVLNWT